MRHEGGVKVNAGPQTTRHILGELLGGGNESKLKGVIESISLFSQKAAGRIWLSLFLSFHKRGCRQPWTDRWGRWGSGRGEQAIGSFSTSPGGSTAVRSSRLVLLDREASMSLKRSPLHSQ